MTEIAAIEKLSEGEERFERGRRFVGCIAAPIVFIVLLATPMAGLKPEAHRLAAVMATVIVLWLTEARTFATARFGEVQSAPSDSWRVCPAGTRMRALPKGKHSACFVWRESSSPYAAAAGMSYRAFTLSKPFGGVEAA